MSTFWLYDGTDTYDLDTNVMNVSIGEIKRNFRQENYLGANGAILKGFGTYSPREITLTRVETKTATSNNAWNSVRNLFISWMTRRVDEDVWFYLRDGEDTMDLRIKVYCQTLPSDDYKNVSITNSRTFKLIAPDGVFTSTTSSSDSEIIIGTSSQTISINNTGNVECPCQFKFTPAGIETSFKVELVDSFSFELGGVFPAGVQIVYDMGNNVFTIGGTEYKVSQYLSNGSIFMLPTGSHDYTVTCSGAGTFEYSFYPRYI